MTESNAKFIERVRPQVSQYETTLIEALERLEKAEAKCVTIAKGTSALCSLERQKLEQEINRLKRDAQDFAGLTKENEALRDERERLRGEVERLEGNYQAGYDDAMQERT